MMMFKSCHTIDEYICIMSGGLIFRLFQGKYFRYLLHF
ncbi:hypothetical protein T05_16146 [Trichinella murrelli]|uniref:Uncharacterized protein n=1 Tax=Trichinella murrelli TaxID=144512 RepID=A0A0V0SNW2_9BILA|nr:hypothetical protein T05_16146 [Trichinella murrelli]